MASITSIEVTNKALILVGAIPITTFNETSAEAVVANQVYEDIVLDALAKHDWSFATGKKDISNNRLAASPLTEYSAAYQAPTSPSPVSYMRLWINNVIAPFTVSEDHVFCNAAQNDEVVLEYQFRPSEDQWSPAFLLFVVYRLASEFAKSITRKSDQIELWAQSASQQFEDARLRDDKGRISPWIDNPLVNQALGLIGALPVTRVTQSAVEALLAHGTMAEIKDQVLAAHDWSFAMKQAQLTHDANANSNTTRPDVFVMPSNPEPLALHHLYVDGERWPYEVEGNRVLVDLGEAKRGQLGTSNPPVVALAYKARVNESEWLPSVRWYAIYRLASEMAGAIGGQGSANLASAMDQKAERQLQKARRENDFGRKAPRMKLKTSITNRGKRFDQTSLP